MPKAPISGQAPQVRVLAVGFTLGVDRTWQKVGDTVSFSGKLTQDGIGWAGQTIKINLKVDIAYPFGPTIASIVTGADGNYSISTTVPFSMDWKAVPYNLPCQSWYFKAVQSGTLNDSNMVALSIAYKTRMRSASLSSYTVSPEEQFEVFGWLEYESSPAIWSPINEQIVSATYDSTTFGSTTTDANGRFDIFSSIPTPGTYTITASYSGEGITQLSIASVEVTSSSFLFITLIVVAGLFLLVK